MIRFKNEVSNFTFVNKRNPQNYSGSLQKTFLSKIGAPVITLGELCGTKINNKNHILYKYPQLRELVIYCTQGDPINGDIDVQFGIGRQTMDAIGISKALASHKNFEKIIESELAPHLQSWVSAMEGELPAHMLAYNFTGKGLESEIMGVNEFSKLNREFLAFKSIGNQNATFDDFLKEVSYKMAEDVAQNYIHGLLLSTEQLKGISSNMPSWATNADYVKTLWIAGTNEKGLGERARNGKVEKELMA